MREILFRGRRKDNYKWYEGFYACYEKKHYIIEMVNELVVNWHEVLPETVGQYTGLKDADGKQIWEGDVIAQYSKPIRRWPERYGKRYCVEMDEGRRGWWPFACGDGCGCCEKDTIYPDGCKVLGNIHDNPELMEVQHE